MNFLSLLVVRVSQYVGEMLLLYLTSSIITFSDTFMKTEIGSSVHVAVLATITRCITMCTNAVAQVTGHLSTQGFTTATALWLE